MSDYHVHELLNNFDDASQSSALPINGFQSSSLQTVNAALLARIEYIEAQLLPETNMHLQRLTSGQT